MNHEHIDTCPEDLVTESQSSPTWVRSRRCESNACVEVAVVGDGLIAMRDSKDPDGPRLIFSREEWDAFVAGTRAGDFSF